MFCLVENKTKRPLPAIAKTMDILQTAKRRLGESIGFDNGCDIALLLDADGKTLAVWEYDPR